MSRLPPSLPAPLFLICLTPLLSFLPSRQESGKERKAGCGARDHEEPRRACRPFAPHLFSLIPSPSCLLDSRVVERIRCKRIRRRLHYYADPRADYRTRVVTSSSSASLGRREFTSRRSYCNFRTGTFALRYAALCNVTCSVSLIAAESTCEMQVSLRRISLYGSVYRTTRVHFRLQL